MSTYRAWFIGSSIALLLSLVANVMLVGWIAGSRLGEPDRLGRGAVQQLARSMPEALRDDLRREIRARARVLARHVAAARTARREVSDLLQQTELDRKRIDEKLAQAREHTAALQKLLQETIVEVASNTDADTRRQWLSQMPRAGADLGRLLNEPSAQVLESQP